MTSLMIKQGSFWRSLRIQLRVIYALIMREIITRYGRHNVGFMWLFLEPMMFTLGVAALWHTTKVAKVGTIAVIPFAVLGYSTILLWRNSSNRVTNAVEANIGLLYHKNVKVMDVFLARVLLEIAGSTMSFLLLFTIFNIVGLMEMPKYPLTLFSGWFFLCWFSIALGFMVGSLSQMSEVVDRVWHALAYLLFPLSGAAFFVDWLPLELQKIILWIPMVHESEMIKHGYYGDIIRTHESLSFIIWCNTLMTFVGLLLVNKISQKLELN